MIQSTNTNFVATFVHQHRWSIILAAILALLSYSAYQFLSTYSRLRGIPGPALAKWTNLQRVSWVRTKRAHKIHHETHEKYGDVVRFGPNMVSLADPAWISSVYPMRPGFPKGNFYRTLMPYTRKGGAMPAVFNTRDENLHKKLKSPIAQLFSLSNVLPLEGFVTEVLGVLCEQLDSRFAETRETFDLADWLQYFAFDVMGTLTFSRRYGFIEKGRDVNNMLSTIWTYMTTAAPMTQIPWFDDWWYKNSFTARFRRTTGFSILSIVGKFISERREEHKGGHDELNKSLGDRDMLSRFFEIQAKNPSIPTWAVTAWTFSNVIAGSDSTAVVMRTVWYNLLAQPQTLQRLRSELIEATKQPGAFPEEFPKWKDVCNLPYLEACINEGVRLHPPFCLPFERVVPAGGVTIGENYFPEGTVVGMSPYVVNRHKPTFGEDADEWRPERWMVEEDERRKLEASMLTFGAGRRVCLGRHIAMLELKKLISALALRYEFDLIDSTKYKVENSWFFRQSGLDVKIQKRAVEATLDKRGHSQ